MTDHAYNPRIVQCLDDRLDHMIDKHNKVLFVRLDVRYPQGFPHDGSNAPFSRFLKLLKEPYTRDGVDLHYVWAREQATSATPHYHVALYVDGAKVQNPHGILRSAEDIWGRVTGCPNGGLVHLCRPDGAAGSATGGVMIRRPSSRAEGPELAAQRAAFAEDVARVRERGLYLAKTHTKGDAPHRVREHQGSQVRPVR